MTGTAIYLPLTRYPAMRYDYTILYRQEDPAATGIAGATMVWENNVVRVCQRT